jgi:putative SOS response-associated peptidase YedK
MCGRFTLTAEPGIVARRFGAPPTSGGNRKPRFNVAPTQTVVTVTAAGERQIEQMKWGLIPKWAEDRAIGAKMINARAETLAEKPAFREAFKRRRCLIPADGFFEWQAIGKRKQAWHVRLKSGEPFAFAGLWDQWTAPDGEPVKTCTIVTTGPNELMSRFHHRMPVILHPADEAAWLDPAITAPDRLLPLLGQYPAALMEAYTVSDLVNRVANDSPQLVLPLDLSA